MKLNLSAAEQMIYSTTRIVGTAKGQTTGTGTGFFYRVLLNAAEKRWVPLLVTNKHVIEGCDAILLNMHLEMAKGSGTPSGEFEECGIELANSGVVLHPDPEIDLCAIPVKGLLEAIGNAGKEVFFVALAKENLPDTDDLDNLDAIEPVKMIGCPNGLFDEVNNLPLTRQGITASSLRMPYQGKPYFVVDMACFPGSSGSPIFLQDDHGYRNRKTNVFHIGARRFFLVGVLFAGPLIHNNGTLTLGRAASFSVASMMHLGYAVRSSELLAFDKHFHALFPDDSDHDNASA